MQNNGNDNDNNGPPLPPPVPVPSYRCICGRTFTLRRNYLRHLQVHQVAAAPNNNVCERCQRTFTRADNLEHHRRTSCSSDPPPPAPWRNRLFRNTGPRQQQPSGSGVGSTPRPFNVNRHQTAFSNANITWKLRFRRNHGGADQTRLK